MEQEKTSIVVHDGPFQADEVFAVALLLMYYPMDDYEIIRTRNEDIISKADIVCDVGGVYSPTSLRFDHHQFRRGDQDYFIPRGLSGTWHEDQRITPSSCGLVLDFLWSLHDQKGSGDMPTPLVDRLMKRLVLGIDAIDNGMLQVPKEVPLRYRPCNISNLIAHYNSDDAFDKDEQLKNFKTAVTVAKFHIQYIDKGYWRDEYNFETIKQKIDTQTGDHLVLDKFYPGHWSMLNRAQALHKFKRVIWPQIDGDGKQEYRIAVPPVDLGQIKFVLEYEGLDKTKVEEKDLVFVHGGKWIGATRTKEAAYKL